MTYLKQPLPGFKSLQLALLEAASHKNLTCRIAFCNSTSAKNKLEHSSDLRKETFIENSEYSKSRDGAMHKASVYL